MVFLSLCFDLHLKTFSFLKVLAMTSRIMLSSFVSFFILNDSKISPFSVIFVEGFWSVIFISLRKFRSKFLVC